MQEEKMTDRQLIVKQAYILFLERTQAIYEAMLAECDGEEFENIEVGDILIWLIEGVSS
jgi:hypothetical protein